jgi:hypothetical protein
MSNPSRRVELGRQFGVSHKTVDRNGERKIGRLNRNSRQEVVRSALLHHLGTTDWTVLEGLSQGEKPDGNTAFPPATLRLHSSAHVE